jgi:hypothetical protein
MKNKSTIYQRNYQREFRKNRVFRFLAIQSNKRNKGKGKITAFDLYCIAHKQRMICPLTGEHLTRATISVDHIVPSSKGGLNIPSNIRLTTRDINYFKRTMTDEALLTLCKQVVNQLSK